MSEEVKFIFKTLIKVPIIILVSFFILNVFAFFFIYFKVLGASYVVMQVAVENNYIPNAELAQLVNHVSEWNNIEWANDPGIIVGIDDSGDYVYVSDVLNQPANLAGNRDARNKRQYGSTVTCGVRTGYKFVWPLSHRETLDGAGLDSELGNGTDNVGVGGFGGGGASVSTSKSDLDAKRKAKESLFDIEITYTVPGLKYYPDLITY